MARSRRRIWNRWTRRVLAAGLIVGAVGLWPVVLMLTAGRSACIGSFDAAVVFGARVYADGTPSDALEDRVLAAVVLYTDGRCGLLIMSGGPGDGAISEAEAMRDLAMARGVAREDIVLDTAGVNTAATAANAARICREEGLMRVVGVTHFYHTPRVSMALRRAGLDADTEPASMRGRVLNKLPYFMLREAAAWWVYLVRE